MKPTVSISLALALVGAAIGATPVSAQLAWTEKKPATAPPARFGHAMSRAHPSYEDILFGGRDASGAFADTWSWDGSTWTLRATSGPSPRFDHAMAEYHFTNDSLIVFGGRSSSGTLLGDTWLWDGTHWTALATAGAPSPRAGHAMVKDDFAIKTLFLFGGRTAQGLSNETWRFANGQWSLVPTVGGPSPREGAALVPSNAPEHFLLIGGRDENATLADTWEFDGITWTEVASLPAPQADAAVVTDDFWRDRPLSFGGDLAGAANSTLERLDDGSWVSHETVGAPSARSDAALALDFGFDHALYVLFGGKDANGNALGDTFTLQPLTMPAVELTGQGCGPGAWGPTGGPSLSASLPPVGSELTVTAFAPAATIGAFVIGSVIDPAPASSCTLQVTPTFVVLAPLVEPFPGLAMATMQAQIPFMPVCFGLEVPMQFVSLAPVVPGGISYSQLMRLRFAE